MDAPLLLDQSLRQSVSALDRALSANERAAAESQLTLVSDALHWHLSGHPEIAPLDPRRGALAAEARDLLDADPVGAPSIG